MSYDMEGAEIDFEIDKVSDRMSIGAPLAFDTARISIATETAAQVQPYSSIAALVSEGDLYHSVFFGDETADRPPLMTVDIEVEGETPLSAIDIAGQPENSTFDSNLRPDQIYWRLPRSEP